MAKSRIKKNARVKQREKVKKKKREKRKRLLKGVGKLSLSFLMVAGLAVAGKKTEDFLLTSSYFRISEVSFKGFNSLGKKTLENLARVERGKNIFRIDLKEVRERLESHPQVRKVIISRRFPRRVEVKVKEREALVLIKNKGKTYAVDEEGIILPQAPLTRPLPLITGLGKVKTKVGENLGEAKFAIALEILEDFSLSGIYISEVDLEGRGPVVRIGKVKVFLGNEERRGEELKELKSIFNDLARRKEKAEYIDLRFNNPVVKLR